MALAAGRIYAVLWRILERLPRPLTSLPPFVLTAVLVALGSAAVARVVVGRWQTVEAIRFGPLVVPLAWAVLAYLFGFLVYRLRRARSASKAAQRCMASGEWMIGSLTPCQKV